MKKFLLSLTLMVASFAAWAETGFYIEDYQGNRVGYYFVDEPVWTFQGDNLVITTVEYAVEYPMDDVARIYFDDVSDIQSSVTEVKVDELIRIIPDGVELSGFAANTTVTAYNLQGQLVGTYRTDESGSLNISLADREQGFYIIKANKSTLKIKK